MNPGRFPALVMSLILVSTLGQPLGAQTLRDKLNDLFIFGDCGRPLCLSDSLGSHGNHFVPSGDTNVITLGLLGNLSSSIVTSVSNIPGSVASGGASVTFVAGLPVTTPISSGPVLGERAPTLGRHRLLVGINLTGGRFDRLNGVRLRDVHLNFTHQDIGNPGLGDPLFENDVITVTPDFHFSLLVTSLFATYGLTNSLDVGMILPVIHASLQGRSIGVITCENPCVHYFGTAAAPQSADTTRVHGSATGIGDVTLRTKLALPNLGRWNFALLAEARLPTGRQENFMGDGHLDVRGQVITSATWGVFTGHANAGYFARGGSELNDAVLVTAGFDLLALPWLTVAADLASQWQVGAQSFSYRTSVTYIAPVVRTLDLTNVPDRRDDRLDGSLGFKLSNGRGLTGLANIYFPLRSAGLQAPLIWTLGVQYDF